LFIRRFVSRLGLSANAAWIVSEVKLGDKAVGQSEKQTDDGAIAIHF